jgi:hypothetical protein
MSLDILTLVLEVAHEMGVDVDEFHKRLTDRLATRAVALSTLNPGSIKTSLTTPPSSPEPQKPVFREYDREFLLKCRNSALAKKIIFDDDVIATGVISATPSEDSLSSPDKSDDGDGENWRLHRSVSVGAIITRSDGDWRSSSTSSLPPSKPRPPIAVIRSDLNKIAEANYDVISQRIFSNTSSEMCKDVASLIVEKAVFDVKFLDWIVKMCVKLCALHPGEQGFQYSLLTACEAEFKKYEDGMLDADDDKQALLKKRRYGFLEFIVKLCKLKVVPLDVIMICMESLIGGKNVTVVNNEYVVQAVTLYTKALDCMSATLRAKIKGRLRCFVPHVSDMRTKFALESVCK